MNKNRPTVSSVGSKNRRMLAFHSASPHCFYEVMQAVTDLTRLERNPRHAEVSTAAPWIDPPRVVSIRHVFAAVYVCWCNMHNGYRPIGPRPAATRSQTRGGVRHCTPITEGEINRDPDQTLRRALNTRGRIANLRCNQLREYICIREHVLYNICTYTCRQKRRNL